MPTWKIAGVQMDCRLGGPSSHLDTIRPALRRGADEGARLVIFPECALTGYAFDSRDEALPFAQPVPGPATEALAADCRELDAWAVLGMLERAGDDLFNACALV